MLRIRYFVEGKVVLGYWAIRGLRERARHLLEYLSIPYSEEEYEGAEGRAKWFDEVKPKLIAKNPAVSLPYLIDGDKVVAESDAIMVHLCHKGGKPELLGRDCDEQVLVATVLGVLKDFHPNYVRLVYGQYNEENPWEKAQAESREKFAPYLRKFDGLLGDKDYYAGGLTWIDFAVAEFFQVLQMLDADYFKDLPRLVAHQKRVWALPELKEYFEKRYKERPCNNYIATWK